MRWRMSAGKLGSSGRSGVETAPSTIPPLGEWFIYALDGPRKFSEDGKLAICNRTMKNKAHRVMNLFLPTKAYAVGTERKEGN